MQVELVSVETPDGVRLDGALRRPAAHSVPELGLDLVICHHGVGGNFYNPSFFDAMGDRLVERGCAVLRANNRGHDIVYNQFGRPGTSWAEQAALRRARGRLGAAYEVIDDARHDWKAWLDFAADEGLRRVAVWSHSLGGVKTVYCLSSGLDEGVICAIASSPPRFCQETHLAASMAEEYALNLGRAQELVDAGSPQELLDVQVPNPNLFAARTFIDKYGPGDAYDFLPRLEKVRVPLLLTLGSEETSPLFADLMRDGPLLQRNGLGYALIDGADHSYMSRLPQLWESVLRFLQSAVPAAAGA